MIENYKEAFELIKNAENILITGHTRPDGDSCGSVCAMSRFLLSMNKNVIPFMITPYSDDMSFILEGVEHFIADPEIDMCKQINDICDAVDLVVLVDTNSRNQLPRFEKWLDTSDAPVIVFDHHITNDGLGDVEIIDTEAAAAGQVVCEFFEALNISISKEMADNMFVAIAADTGWFRFGNRNKGDVYAMAGRLIDRGADPAKIYQKLYQQMPEGKLRLLAKSIDSMKLYFDGQVAFQHLFLSDFTATGTKGRDTGGLVNEPNKIATVDVSAMFIEQPNGQFKCSMRSKGKVNVRVIAQKYGGGGHDLAAGVTLDKSLDEAKALIKEEIAKQL
ncbi:MAG: bifunctional oligoribonuclease/PAP phosphatase NrnA [Sedimentisphaeraceae bacterium JB056]